MSKLKIDRTIPFDPTVTFLGDGWSTVMEDQYSLKITEVDLNQVHFVVHNFTTDKASPKEGVNRIVALIKAQPFNLDARVLQVIDENISLIPERWKTIAPFPVMAYIPFCGSVFRDPDGIRYILCLEWFVISSSLHSRVCAIPIDSITEILLPWRLFLKIFS